MNDKPRIGRPPILVDVKRVVVYITAANLEQARTMGDGNLSAGIRLALDMAGETALEKQRNDELSAKLQETLRGYA